MLLTRVGLALLVCALFVPSRDCATRQTPAAALPASPTAPPAPTALPDGFVFVVRPILTAHCAPCHEPGGKMYERLPFDQAKTIADHSEGVLRRLKGEDRDAVEKWLAGASAKPLEPRS